MESESSPHPQKHSGTFLGKNCGASDMKKKTIYLASPHMSEAGYELEYIHDAFQKNWIAPLGENVTEFETSIKNYTGSPCAVSLSSGTAALHLAMILSGVGAGDLVFCQSLTFSASVNPVSYLGAKPVFIDSEKESWNMDPEALKLAFERYGRPKAVVVVHLCGNPAKMEEISRICKEQGVPLIEDAAEALGSVYHGERCGTLGDFGILSFNGNKIITTSGGGMLLCRDESAAAHALKLATQAREPFPWYEHEEIGYNYRMSNISAGIGRGQMRVLDERVQKKNEIFDRYRRKLEMHYITMMESLPNARSNRWLSAGVLDPSLKKTPGDVIRMLREEDIEARHMWKPMHMQPVFSGCPFVKVGEEDVSQSLFRYGICLPSDTKMTEEEQDHVIDLICGFVEE